MDEDLSFYNEVLEERPGMMGEELFEEEIDPLMALQTTKLDGSHLQRESSIGRLKRLHANTHTMLKHDHLFLAKGMFVWQQVSPSPSPVPESSRVNAEEKKDSVKQQAKRNREKISNEILPLNFDYSGRNPWKKRDVKTFIDQIDTIGKRRDYPQNMQKEVGEVWKFGKHVSVNTTAITTMLKIEHGVQNAEVVQFSQNLEDTSVIEHAIVKMKTRSGLEFELSIKRTIMQGGLRVEDKITVSGSSDIPNGKPFSRSVKAYNLSETGYAEISSAQQAEIAKYIEEKASRPVG